MGKGDFGILIGGAFSLGHGVICLLLALWERSGQMPAGLEFIWAPLTLAVVVGPIGCLYATFGGRSEESHRKPKLIGAWVMTLAGLAIWWWSMSHLWLEAWRR